MALQKKFTKPNGIETNYHRVTQTSLNVYDDQEHNILNVFMTSYLNKEKRDEDQSIETLYYRFEVIDDEDTTMGIRELAYKKIKELPEWADAVDC